MCNRKTMQFEFHEIMCASRNFNNRKRSVLIASVLMFMHHSIVYIDRYIERQEPKILFVNRYYFNLY